MEDYEFPQGTTFKGKRREEEDDGIFTGLETGSDISLSLRC